MKKILLHACCAPCTTYTYQWLKENDFDATGFFYNPNIYPNDEYEKRKKCMEYYCAISRLPMLFVEEKAELKAGNCQSCYASRLSKTARYGRANGFDAFSTTLLISPYQKHDLIKEIGSRIADEEKIEFIYNDFREGFYKSREISAKLNLYKQKYCGCGVSLEARRIKNEQVA